MHETKAVPGEIGYYQRRNQPHVNCLEGSIVVFLLSFANGEAMTVDHGCTPLVHWSHVSSLLENLPRENTDGEGRDQSPTRSSKQ